MVFRMCPFLFLSLFHFFLSFPFVSSSSVTMGDNGTCLANWDRCVFPIPSNNKLVSTLHVSRNSASCRRLQHGLGAVWGRGVLNKSQRSLLFHSGSIGGREPCKSCRANISWNIRLVMTIVTTTKATTPTTASTTTTLL